MSDPQNIFKRLREIAAHIRRHIVAYSLLSVGVISEFVFLSLASGHSLRAKEAQEKKEVDALTQLVAMRTQMAELQKALVQKINSRPAQGHHSNLNTSKVVLDVKPSEGFKQVVDLKEDLYIPRGSVFQARLLTSIKTALSATVVVAETTRTFEMDHRRRVPAHSKIIGEAVFDPAMKGVIVRFRTLTSPKGEQFDGLDLLAISENAWPELDGIVFDNSGVEMATALSFGFLSGFSSAGQDREATIVGSIATPSMKNQILSGLSVASFQVAQEALDKVKSQTLEYVVVPANTPIFVLFNSKWNLPAGGIKG